MIKLGDKVKIITEWSCYEGKIGTVIKIEKFYRTVYTVQFSDNNYTTFGEEELEIMGE